VAYGYLAGMSQFEVHHIVYASNDLPAAFDGYRIVQFSDAHIGTMTGSREWMRQQMVDSINSQQPDAIVFTGDMQNICSDELQGVTVFRQLRAKDGVYSILGNHDYAKYIHADEAEKERHCRMTIEAERQMGFDLLLNEHRIIRRDTDSIVIAGMENWGKTKRMPRKGDVGKTLEGLQLKDSDGHQPFIVMLQHDPTCWREKILPECSAQLTLSGHTHGGQFSLFGLSPASLTYDEWSGTTYEGSRALHVSTGVGALIPFRLGLPREIVVVTLKKK
jgi:predicted MPP superfamily phosphohydrolase